MIERWRPPTLETERLILRPIEVEDAEAIFAYSSNPNLTLYTLWETHQSIEDTLTFVRDFVQMRYRQGVPDPMGLVLRDDPTKAVIGTVGCFWASEPNATMELGYALAEEHWGKGLIREAANALLVHVFREFAPERVQAHCFVQNVASERVLQKLGMKFEGTLRKAVRRRGEYWNLHIYSILREEWLALQSAQPH